MSFERRNNNLRKGFIFIQVGQKVRVSFEMTITNISHNEGQPDRSFVSGNVSIGGYEKVSGKVRSAFVSGVPFSVVESLD